MKLVPFYITIIIRQGDNQSLKTANVKPENVSETTKSERKEWFVFPKSIYSKCEQIGEKATFDRQEMN